MNLSHSENKWKTSPTQLVNFGAYAIYASVLLGCISFMHVVHRNTHRLENLQSSLPDFLGYITLGVLVFQITMFVACWLQTRFTVYSIEDGVLHTQQGIFFRNSKQLELYRIKDYEVVEPLFLRLFGYGHLELHTSDRTDKTLLLMGLHSPQKFAVELRALVEMYRKTKNVREVD